MWSSSNKIKALISIRMADKKGDLCSKSLDFWIMLNVQKLLRLFGIGQWTCDMTSIFYYQSPDIWPTNDVTVQRQFGRLIGQRKPETAIQQFVPYRTYLALAIQNRTQCQVVLRFLLKSINNVSEQASFNHRLMAWMLHITSS